MQFSDTISARLAKFATYNSPRDLLRILKFPVVLALQFAKIEMMVNCGCQVNELNNWMSHAIRDPYYWRISREGINFVAGPYSPLWYLLNQPARLGYLGWMSYLLIVDSLFTILIFTRHSWKMIIPYCFFSVYFYNTDPIDFFIFQFAILGVQSWKWSALAVVTKIPWITLPFSTPVWFPFPPSYVWNFVLHDPYALNEPGGIQRYALIGLPWLASVLFYTLRTRRKQKLMRSQDLHFQV